jgi:hypothetical protein
MRLSGQLWLGKVEYIAAAFGMNLSGFASKKGSKRLFRGFEGVFCHRLRQVLSGWWSNNGW